MWTSGIWVELALSSGIGLSLGLIGGGGSIITVPVLVYVAGLPVGQAVALSLAIVGMTAAVGATLQARSGNVHWKAAVIYGFTGMIGASLGARLTSLVAPPVLMTLFAALMIFVGLGMLRRKEVETPRKTVCDFGKCAVAGFAIGVLTGFLGVGGGFLIVPALLRFTHMAMPQAIGTSLVIIAANSAAGFVSHLPELQNNMSLALTFTAAAIAGMFIGIAAGRNVKPEGLKSAFCGLSLAVAAYLLVMNVKPLLSLWNV